MIQLTDEQLLLLEQIAYLNGDIEKAAGLSDRGLNGKIRGLDPHSTVADLIGNYDDDAIAKLRELGDKSVSSEITGNELAALIETIKSDEELMNLELQVKDDEAGAYCFTDSDGEAVVIFRGTTSGDEWYDNFTGLGTSDTEIQKETRDFIEGLPYDDITAVGHSKGGNKAMYSAIVSDKVSRAVSMDGQGFSQEFMHKYEEEIRKNASKITNYSLDADFVHILLYQVPGSRQVYIDGNDYVNKAKNHSPINLFYFVKDENGVWRIDTDENGKPVLHVTTENEGMTYLHLFTIFVLENCPIEDRVVIGEYLGRIMACMMRPGVYTFTDADGTVYDSSNIMEYIFKYPDRLGMVLAYVMKFAETYNMTEEQLWAFFEAMGLAEMIRTIEEGIETFASMYPVAAAALGFTGRSLYEILKLIMANIVDGKRDPIIEQLLSWLSKWLSEKVGVPLNLDRLWISIEESYTAIGDVDPVSGTVNTLDTENKVFDYSMKAYNTLRGTMQKIDNLTSGSISSWNSTYSSEKWYGDLGISIFVNGIESYGSRLKDINADCRSQIDRIFEKVWTIDSNKAKQLAGHGEQLKSVLTELKNLAESIG